MKAMILAAGRGNRLRPITDSIPKALVNVRGKSLIEHHLDSMSQVGIEEVVINLGWLGDQIEAHVGDGSRFGLSVNYSDERGNVLETGGGIHKALPLLGKEPFLVVNADIFTDMPLPGHQLANGILGHLSLVPTPAYKAKGDFALVGGKVRNADLPDLTFGGVALYHPEFFTDCTPGRFSLAPMLAKATNAGLLTGEVYSGLWEDVGTVERLNRLNLP